MNISSARNGNNTNQFQINILPLQITTILLMFGCIWLFISFLKYGEKQKVWKQKVKNSKLLTFAVIIPVFTLLRLILTQSLITFGYFGSKQEYSNLVCMILTSTNTCLYATVLMLVYSFLWLRQRTLYSDPTLKHLNTKIINYISIFSLPLVFIGLLSICIFFLLSTHRHTENGCVFVFLDQLGTTALYLSNGFTCLSQIVLFLLFFYPLRRHIFLKSNRTNQSSSISRRLSLLIRQSSWCLICCIISDLISMLFAREIGLLYGHATAFSMTIYNVNLFVNILSIMFCFEAYKDISLQAFIYFFKNANLQTEHATSFL